KGVSNDAKQDLDLDLLTHNMNNDGKNQAFQSSVRLSDQPSLPNSETDPEAQTLITDEECCRVLFPDTMKDSCTSSGEQGRNMIDPQKGKGSICSQSAETLVHETGKLPALSWHPSSSEGLAVHNCVPLLDTGLERKPDTNDGFIDTDGHI
ncbi:PREDICTED: myb-related protein 3R-1-like, partial [Camelina sativa]|uniref:Myb-related protein 3R-1-like n=1 Tax=Camelina sativa TaxID=90675 RepID=A0ABM1RHY0_CAMSA